MGLIGCLAEILVLACCAAAVITNVFLIISCDLVDVFNEEEMASGSVGLFYYDPPRADATNEECLEITGELVDDINDKALKCARVCSVMALCCGVILFVFGFFQQCLFPLPCTQALMDLSSMMVQISLALVYVIWMSRACEYYSCTRGDGMNFLIVTQVLWLVAGCFTRCMRPGRLERWRERRDDHEK